MKLRMFVFVLLVSVMMVGCLANWVNPEVRNLSTQDLSKAPTVLAQYTKDYQIPTGWLGGVVFQQSWKRSIGLHTDPYNFVRLRVYIPNKMVIVIPCNPRQEAGFVEDYMPGDIVAMAWDGTARVGQPQDTARLCKEDMIMMKKGGALNSTSEAKP